MNNIGFPLSCRWGGNMVTQQGVINYEGGRLKVVMLKSHMKFNDLVDKVCKMIGIDRMIGDVKLIMRYPAVGGQFLPLPLDDDEAMEAVWACVGNIPTLEVYVEQTQVQPSNYAYLNPHSSTQSVEIPTQSTIGSWDIGYYSRVLHNDININQHLHTSDSGPSSIAQYHPVHPQHEPSQPLHVVETIVEEENRRGIYFGNDEHMNRDTEYENEFVQERQDEPDNEVENDGEDVDIGEGALIPSWNEIGPEDWEFVNNWVSSNPQTEFTLDGEFMVGQQFNTKADLLCMVKIWCVRRNHIFKTAESRPDTVTLTCGRDGNENSHESCP
jgi:hypothetical protein